MLLGTHTRAGGRRIQGRVAACLVSVQGTSIRHAGWPHDVSNTHGENAYIIGSHRSSIWRWCSSRDSTASKIASPAVRRVKVGDIPKLTLC
ncbi:hypothetical protein N658DRAFT_496515 [Parathielavia hyrcaniae]|uniref:Uncharacterized protein n=1 Tax=Parathielavia hyrcaniae TaxID=113614 RepID=A0AAN6Q0A2_9PEZI|nr:hypothetical protein N658DRAFT_496515 [Parathielavia hyrcaniae]